MLTCEIVQKLEYTNLWFLVTGFWGLESGVKIQVSGLRSQVSGLGSWVSGLRSLMPVTIVSFFCSIPISIGFPFETLHLINVSSTCVYIYIYIYIYICMPVSICMCHADSLWNLHHGKFCVLRGTTGRACRAVPVRAGLASRAGRLAQHTFDTNLL